LLDEEGEKDAGYEGGEIFCTLPDRHWSPPSLLYKGYRVLPGGKAAGAWRSPPTNVSEQYQSQVHRPLEDLQLKHNHYNVIHIFAQAVVTESYTLARRIPTPRYLPYLNTFQVSIDQNYAVKKINIRGNVVDSKIQMCFKNVH